MNADLRRLLRDLRRSGYWIEQHKHFAIHCPSGRTIRCSCTPSDHRAMNALLSELRRDAWGEQKGSGPPG